MEGLVLVGLTQLYRQGGAGGEVGGFAQDRELLVDVANVFVFRQQLLDQRVGTLAVAAVVVEEFDHGQAALGIAALRILVAIELLGVCLDQGLVVGSLLALLLGAQGVGHLDQDFRVLDQIVAHYLFHVALGQFARLNRRRKQGGTRQGAKQGMFDFHKSILLGIS